MASCAIWDTKQVCDWLSENNLEVLAATFEGLN